MPIASLPIPIAVPVRVPVFIIPIGIGVNSLHWYEQRPRWFRWHDIAPLVLRTVELPLAWTAVPLLVWTAVPLRLWATLPFFP